MRFPAFPLFRGDKTSGMIDPTKSGLIHLQHIPYHWINPEKSLDTPPNTVY